jgi:hypothetical protein
MIPTKNLEYYSCELHQKIISNNCLQITMEIVGTAVILALFRFSYFEKEWLTRFITSPTVNAQQNAIKEQTQHLHKGRCPKSCLLN